jgi:hypothetical protein
VEVAGGDQLVAASQLVAVVRHASSNETSGAKDGRSKVTYDMAGRAVQPRSSSRCLVGS